MLSFLMYTTRCNHAQCLFLLAYAHIVCVCVCARVWSIVPCQTAVICRLHSRTSDERQRQLEDQVEV